MMNEQAQTATPPHFAQFINAAHYFMGNTTLKGSEVESYAQAFNFLQSILAGELVVLPVAAYDTLTKAAVAHQQRLNAEKEAAAKELNPVES
jgi:hypothetical protein